MSRPSAVPTMRLAKATIGPPVMRLPVDALHSEVHTSAPQPAAGNALIAPDSEPVAVAIPVAARDSRRGNVVSVNARQRR